MKSKFEYYDFYVDSAAWNNKPYTHFETNFIDKWILQNDAETIDFFEGILIDNMVLSCKKGIAFIFEKPVSSWKSVYNVFFFRNHKRNTREYKQIENIWYTRYDAIQENMGEKES